MREGWEMKKLGEVIEITNGRSQKDVVSNQGNYPIIGSGGNVMGYATNFICDAGTTIIGRKGNISKPIFVNEKFWNVDTAFGLYPKDEKQINRRFIYFLCLNINFEKLNRGTTIPSLVKSELQLIPISVPPLPEQQRIVSILDEAFAAIDKAKANVQKNLNNAKELFQSSLNTIFSQKGESWEEKKLGEIALTFSRGKSKHRPRNDEKLYGGKYPFIQTGDVRNSNKVINAYSQTYNEVGLAQSKIWTKGTICITIAANIAETAILGFDSCFPDSMIGLIVDPKKVDVEFSYYMLQHFKSKLQMLGKGSAQDNINLGTFETQRFPFPSLIKQKEIVLLMNKLSSQTQKLQSLYQQKQNELDDLKKSLLEKAFKGELVSEPLIAAD